MKKHFFADIIFAADSRQKIAHGISSLFDNKLQINKIFTSSALIYRNELHTGQVEKRCNRQWKSGIVYWLIKQGIRIPKKAETGVV